MTCRIERNIKGLSKCTTTRGKRSAFYFMSFFFLILSWCNSINTMDQGLGRVRKQVSFVGLFASLSLSILICKVGLLD